MNDEQLHQADRPAWICREGCGQWPCLRARKLMTEAHCSDPDQIRSHLLRVMAIAADELLVSNPTDLYRRFVRWAEPRDVVCRLCDRPNHDYLAGLPPRLFPCNRGLY
jgi:hypothetical protein